jgi:O-antigen ligase
MARPAEVTQQFSLRSIAFFLPFTMTFIYPFCILLVISEFFQKDFYLRLKSQLLSPFVLAFNLFFFAHIVGLFWTEDMEAGLDTLGRVVPYIFFGIFWVAAKYEHQESYTNSFISGLFVCSVIAHYNFFHLMYPDIVPQGLINGKRGGLETAPFLSHVMYAPILALGSYLVIRQLLIPSEIFKLRFFLLRTMVALSLILNLAISSGRAGFLLFLALLFCLFLESSRSKLIGLTKIIIFMPAICLVAYQIPDVQIRVDAGIHDVLNFTDNAYSSLGLRVIFSMTAYDMFLQYPFFGVGTGDFMSEYSVFVPQIYKDFPITNNPHNQYLFTLATLGIFGGIVFLNLIIRSIQYGDARAKSIVFGFLLISFFESYFWRSNTTMMFLFFMAVFCQRRTFLFTSIK